MFYTIKLLLSGSTKPQHLLHQTKTKTKVTVEECLVQPKS